VQTRKARAIWYEVFKAIPESLVLALVLACVLPVAFLLGVGPSLLAMAMIPAFLFGMLDDLVEFFAWYVESIPWISFCVFIGVFLSNLWNETRYRRRP